MSIFGTFVSQWDVEQAVIATLRTWIRTYLAEVERQAGLDLNTLQRPPTPESIYGDVDFTAWQQDQMPAIIVICNPSGAPEGRASAGYEQVYEVQVGAGVIREEVDEARMHASYYGTAISGVILQHGSLGGIAQRTIMVSAPTVSLPVADVRVDALCVTVFHVFIDGIVTDAAGPDVPTPPDSPQYPGSPDGPWSDWPTVRSTSIDLDIDPIDSSS